VRCISFYRQIVDAFDAFEKGSLNIANINASAGSKIAKSNASSELSTTLLAYTSLIGKSQTMLASGKKMGRAGLSAADKKREEYCGTDYINEIDYGATLAVLVEISASSLEDKQKINGLLKFSSDGTIEVDEQLKKYVENKSENYNIKISINQMGGKSHLNLWPASLVCLADSLDPCLIAVNKVLKYMKTGFNSDFESNPEFWVPMKYKTVSYGKEPGFERLVLAKLTDKQEGLLTKAQQNIFEAYEVTIRDQKDATLMKNSILADAKASAFDQVIQATSFNAYVLEKIAAKCSESFQYCIDIASDPKEMELRTYNNHFRKL
jgi:hypothetical protein